MMRMWGAPIALAILTLIGLISALVGDGVWDHVSAVALGVPVALCLWYGLPRRTKND
jgi:membrane associated rhomboid family serine protease